MPLSSGPNKWKSECVKYGAIMGFEEVSHILFFSMFSLSNRATWEIHWRITTILWGPQFIPTWAVSVSQLEEWERNLHLTPSWLLIFNPESYLNIGWCPGSAAIYRVIYIFIIIINVTTNTIVISITDGRVYLFSYGLNVEQSSNCTQP